jgi:GTP-binding protein EngB required for normal cell division
MITDKNSYVEIQKDIVKYSDKLASKDELDSFNQHIESKLADFKPTLMIYGTYNAGKSTLLNALFGQDEMAKTGDAPETKDVHEYKYNGYTIFDTPGLNAKKEDDIVTIGHLEKSEVILFVLSNDGNFEENYVYDKISEVIKGNKPIIIVLNNKNGIDPNSNEAKQSMIKIGENLRKIGDKNGIKNIETKVDIHMVNAKTALKGKLENKNLLLNKSNILQLEKMIEKLLNTSGSEDVINALNIYIQNFIGKVITTIDNKIDNIQVQKTEEMITYLEKFKQSSSVKLKNIVTKKMPSFIDTITSMLLSSGTSEDDINTYISDTINEINNQAMDISKNIESDLSIKVDDFSQEFKNLNAEYTKMDISQNSDESNEDSLITAEIRNKVGETLKNKKLIEEGAKQVLLKAKDLLPKDIMFGKGPVWISKAAGKVAIGVSVALEAYSMYKANEEHQQMIENERNRTIGAKNNAESLADNIQSSLFNSIDDMINDTFNNIIIGFKDASKKLNHDNSALLSNKGSLQSLSNSLQS